MSGAPASIPTPRTMAHILAETARDHRVNKDLILGDVRKREAARPRQDFMWRCRQVHAADGRNRFSHARIAKFLGLKDHTTIVHGVKAHATRNHLGPSTILRIVEASQDSAILPNGERLWNQREHGECCYPTGGAGRFTVVCAKPADGCYCPSHRALMDAQHLAANPTRKSKRARLAFRMAAE